MQRHKQHQAGGASLFIVIFAALLMLVVTMSFVQIMISDQKQASTMDLSQSAYDSAQAGVEDAKRALLLRDRCGSAATAECVAARAALASSYQKCNTVRYALTGAAADDSETRVMQGANDGALNQAYTCAKVIVNTDDYEKTLAKDGDSVLVPLRPVDGQQFDQVRVSWFVSADADKANGATFPVNAPEFPKNTEAAWPKTTPPVLRAQFMQTGASFALDQFDGGEGVVGNNANALFLYPVSPTTAGGLTGADFNLFGRRSGTAEPVMIKCKTSLVGGAYACTATIDLPTAVGGAPNIHNNAFMYVTALYNKTSVKVEMLRSGSIVQFDGVQPIADVTGRADNVFRRVKSRIELGDAVYPTSAVDVDGDLCKNFTITNNESEYNNGGCTP